VLNTLDKIEKNNSEKPKRKTHARTTSKPIMIPSSRNEARKTNKTKEQQGYQDKVADQVNDLEECEVMVELGRMGFYDFDRNLMLCRIYENDLDRCVAAL
jgi:hypothetical protein